MWGDEEYIAENVYMREAEGKCADGAGVYVCFISATNVCVSVCDMRGEWKKGRSLRGVWSR